jgi:hypothetical protein
MPGDRDRLCGRVNCQGRLFNYKINVLDNLLDIG